MRWVLLVRFVFLFCFCFFFKDTATTEIYTLSLHDALPIGLRAFGVDVPDIRSGDLEIIRQPLDFYGVNIYQAHQVTMGADGQPETVTRPRGWPTTMHHWPVTPEALYWGPDRKSTRLNSSH